MRVLPNGDMYDSLGKYYYALYWDEIDNSKISFDTGFYIEADKAIDFLEEKLSIIGLTDKERNEFKILRRGGTRHRIRPEPVDRRLQDDVGKRKECILKSDRKTQL